MSGVSPVGGYPILTGLDAPALPAYTAALTTELDKYSRPVVANEAERDSKYAAMIAAGTRGMQCYVTSAERWYVYDDAWRILPTRGKTFDYGIRDTMTSSVGLFSCPHTLGVTSVSFQCINEYAGGSDEAAYYLLSRIKIGVRALQFNNVVCLAFDSTTLAGYANAAIRVHWIACAV